MKAKPVTKPRSTRTTAKRKARSCKIPRPGQKCPHCRQGKLDYDGLLNLVCPQCGQSVISGGFT